MTLPYQSYIHIQANALLLKQVGYEYDTIVDMTVVTYSLMIKNKCFVIVFM